MSRKHPIYIATVLLEKNRWDSRIPSFKVGDWAQRFADAGFDGIELWENHLLLDDKTEWEPVAAGPLPVTVLNTYCSFDDDGENSRDASAELARFLEAPAVKFNFGSDPKQIPAYIDNLIAWRNELPEGCRLLCECHPGTVLEKPENAAEILSPLHGQVEIITHAFSGDDDNRLGGWLDAFGSAVTHIHAVLGDRINVTRRVEMLENAGFSGTLSIEFCQGVNTPPEDMDTLLATAADDMNYLRKELI